MDNIFRAAKREKSSVESLESVKKELYEAENINEAVGRFEERHPISSSLFEGAGNDEALLRLKLLNSRIRERQEINEKLKILLYHLVLLKATKLTKDYNAAKRCMRQFTRNNFTKVSGVLKDISSFRKDIESMEKIQKELFANISLTLDIRLNNEFGCKKLVDGLYNINKKQEQIISFIGKDFISTAKELIKKEEYRRFLKGISE